MKLRLSELAGALGGALVGDDVEVDGATQDSRALIPGQLFVPLHAERNGHDFIAAAVAAGAPAYLTSEGAIVDLSASALLVDDTQVALQQAGALVRQRLNVPVIAITGSVGKTSTKDLTAATVGAQRHVWASEKSFNNEIGVPLTLFNCPSLADAVVLEMGARGLGHIALLCEIATPTIGIVTVVAGAHLAQFGSIEGVARAKGELVEALPVNGYAILNADDPHVAAMAQRTSARVITYGSTGQVTARDVVVEDDLTSRFRVESPWGHVEVVLGVRGRHAIGNALAALAAAGACGVDLAAAAAALAEPQCSPWRMEMHRSPSGGWVINDAYNANPTSMRAALEALAELPAQRRLAVLGPMAELGTDSVALHQGVAATGA